MKMTFVLYRYLMSFYATYLGLVLGFLLAIIYLFDVIELSRRASKVGGASFPTLLEMGIFKLPEVAQMVASFGVLFAALLCFWSLSRRSELVVMRAAGLSVWQFLSPIVLVALIFGVLMTTVINPIGAVFSRKYQALEDSLLEREKHLVSLFEGGLWLRQEVNEGYFLLHARKVKLPEWGLSDVMVLWFTPDSQFLRRIDADAARMEPGHWVLLSAVQNTAKGTPPTQEAHIDIPTTLTSADIEESFAAPETISFWGIPGFIRTLEATGFDSTRLRIHFQTLLSAPALSVAMVLLAAIVGLQNSRSRKNARLLLAGAVSGFFVFFLSHFLQALGASGQIPILLSAWTPALLVLCGASAVLLHQEDG